MDRFVDDSLSKPRIRDFVDVKGYNTLLMPNAPLHGVYGCGHRWLHRGCLSLLVLDDGFVLHDFHPFNGKIQFGIGAWPRCADRTGQMVCFAGGEIALPTKGGSGLVWKWDRLGAGFAE